MFMRVSWAGEAGAVTGNCARMASYFSPYKQILSWGPSGYEELLDLSHQPLLPWLPIHSANKIGIANKFREVDSQGRKFNDFFACVGIAQQGSRML